MRAVAEGLLEVRRKRRLAVDPPDLQLIGREQEIGFARVERATRAGDVRELRVHAPAMGKMVVFERALHPCGHEPLYHWIFGSPESPLRAQIAPTPFESLQMLSMRLRREYDALAPVFSRPGVHHACVAQNAVKD